MTTATKQHPRRMTAAEIEAELSALAENSRRDAIAHEQRDFEAEAREAHDDPVRGPRMAEEIKAEATLYRARVARRQARVEALESALADLQAADVTGRLEELASQHVEARQAAEKALANVDFPALDAFEEQVDTFLAAAQQARNAAVEAASVAKGKAPAPGLPAVKAARVDALHDRLTRMATRIAAPDRQSRRDLSMFDVHRLSID